MNKKLLKLVTTALFMALCCASTFIHIPSPASQGYLNMGDCLVLLSGWLLGPVYGFVAAGVGSAISDVVLGYAIYAPATFIIKGLMALTAFSIIRIFSKNGKEVKILPRILSAVTAEIIMIGGYYLYDSLITRNFVSSLAGVAGNTIQALFAIVSSVIIIEIFKRSKFNTNFR